MSALRWIPALALAGLCAGAGATVFDNGQVNVVDTKLFSDIRIYDGPGGARTTVIARDGADVGAILVREHSLAIMQASTLVTGKIDVNDDARAELHGGSAEWIDLWGRATAFIDGGTFASGTNTLRMSNDSSAVIAGGSFSATVNNVVSTSQNTRLTITGGSFTGPRIVATGAVRIDIHGGSFAGLNGDPMLLLNLYDSITTIHGWGFNLPMGAIPHAYNGPLTGFLASGEPISVMLDAGGFSGSPAHFVLAAPVPEPPAALLLGAGAAWLAWRRRRVAR